ncbi:intraflagellar transport protein 81 homolog [Patella vulgata]|uniref:intraflagellar transport protein 81 homolog n=1 Tax=Patella vulgata TaxID=6465 RepID=UPI00217F25BB|nr:intraflagellar transport protein 81 homolog [Patella vulgata]XP_050404872.1 intraflagellar transport protein 81 homolog [Patella vulgata]
MSEQLKYIIQELNKPPFNKNYNLISFDSVEQQQLLQVLSDTLSFIDPKQKVDIREETPDQTAIRIFQLLRVLKYKPPTDGGGNLSTFRSGIVQGEKPVIYPILEWILQRVPELQKRAYLAKYLVKVEIPAEIMQDEEVTGLYAQYEDLMEQFKELHKQSETLKGSSFNTSEIRKDIVNMEEEKEQLNKRIERLRRKVESHPNSQKMMNVARMLRVERDREKKIGDQKQEQQILIQHAEQRTKRMVQQLKDMQQASVGATAESLIERLEEETKTNTYLVKEKLPKDLAGKKKNVQDLQKVVSEPAMGQSDLNELQQQIQGLNAEVNELIEKRMRAGDPSDDKLSLFKQQAGIIVHKKDSVAENLRTAREEYNRFKEEAIQKREQAQSVEGGEVLKGEDFKRYVNKLRSKSTFYKKKRQEVAELKAEVGTLQRTIEILQKKEDTVNAQLSHVEKKKGVSGYRETQDNLEKVSSMKSDFDDMKGKTLEDISEMVQRLHVQIQQKRSTFAPILREIRPLRETMQTQTPEYENKKAAYDRCQAGLESNMQKLEHEVRGYREEVKAEESRYHYLSGMMTIMETQQQRINEEMKAYVSSDPSEKRKTYRDMYNKKIQEQSNLGTGLREKQKSIREMHEPNLHQVKMWKDLSRLMECKRQCSSGMSGGDYGSGGGGVQMSGGPGYMDQAPNHLEEDRLVL